MPFAFTTNAMDVLDKSDYILSATNDGKPFMKVGVFRPGTFVWDVARPFDFVSEPGDDSGVAVFEGGMVNQPEKVMFGDTNIAHHPAGINLACLSETIALCMEGVEHDYSLGSNIPYKQAREVYNLCLKHGFSHYSVVEEGAVCESAE